MAEAESIALRPAGPEDTDFLFRLFSSARAPELAAFGWSEEQQGAFLRMQYVARERHYRACWPDADDRIVTIDGRNAGRICVFRAPAALLLIDIALLPEYRNIGIGGRLINSLCDEADRARIPVRLHVDRSNPAARLYRRLGFAVMREEALYLEMERAVNPRTASP
jgi:ribosomal protein S18 acetylase RimI-like enzyme